MFLLDLLKLDRKRTIGIVEFVCLYIININFFLTFLNFYNEVCII